MSLAKVISFDWERIAKKVNPGDNTKRLLLLRSKANEICSNHAKYAVKSPPIEFQAYKKKLKFIGSSVDTLEKVYQSRKLPKYTATLPDFHAKKRAALVEAAKEFSAAAEADLANIKKALEEFDANRFNDDSTYDDVARRFPSIAKEVDEEINEHDWLNEMRPQK